jgi:hypothetical protein
MNPGVWARTRSGRSQSGVASTKVELTLGSAAKGSILVGVRLPHGRGGETRKGQEAQGPELRIRGQRADQPSAVVIVEGAGHG